jgi:hypothetical protein
MVSGLNIVVSRDVGSDRLNETKAGSAVSSKVSVPYGLRGLSRTRPCARHVRKGTFTGQLS